MSYTCPMGEDGRSGRSLHFPQIAASHQIRFVLTCFKKRTLKPPDDAITPFFLHLQPVGWQRLARGPRVVRRLSAQLTRSPFWNQYHRDNGRVSNGVLVAPLYSNEWAWPDGHPYISQGPHGMGMDATWLKWRGRTKKKKRYITNEKMQLLDIPENHLGIPTN